MFDFDVETYTGFSIYLPSNLEIESSAKRTNLLSILPVTASSSLLVLNLSAPEVGASKWALNYNTSDGSITEGAAKRTWVDLGLISADRGKWTDFVIRHRWNPFASGKGYACSVNPASDLGVSGAVNKKFPCDAGILQVWKSTGEVDKHGNRKMTQFVNIVNGPVGLVPRSDHQIRHNFQVYKGQWQQSSTSVAGPVWIGFDEIRFGYAEKNETKFTNVSPSDTAIGDTVIEPGPPRNLHVVN
jgi:hypothetical protein